MPVLVGAKPLPQTQDTGNNPEVQGQARQLSCVLIFFTSEMLNIRVHYAVGCHKPDGQQNETDNEQRGSFLGIDHSSLSSSASHCVIDSYSCTGTKIDMPYTCTNHFYCSAIVTFSLQITQSECGYIVMY
jgi:hypothetical protein